MEKQSIVESIKSDIYSLDAKINLITQKIKTIEKNEEIIGRTMVTYNERLKEVEQKGAGSNQREDAAQTEDIEGLRTEIHELKKTVMELKYVLDSINPLDYATIDQVKELLDERIKKK